jgi:hypothetical protein
VVRGWNVRTCVGVLANGLGRSSTGGDVVVADVVGHVVAGQDVVDQFAVADRSGVALVGRYASGEVSTGAVVA